MKLLLKELIAYKYWSFKAAALEVGSTRYWKLGNILELCSVAEKGKMKVIVQKCLKRSQIKIPLSPRREWLYEQVASKQMRAWIYGAGSSWTVYSHPVMGVPELTP